MFFFVWTNLFIHNQKDEHKLVQTGRGTGMT